MPPGMMHFIRGAFTAGTHRGKAPNEKEDCGQVPLTGVTGLVPNYLI